MTKKDTATRRLGSIPHIETEAFRKLFKDAGLSRADFAALAGAGVQRVKNGGYTSSTVDKWLSGTRLMPADTCQLVSTRLFLLKNHHATFQELVNQPLKDIIARLVTYDDT